MADVPSSAYERLVLGHPVATLVLTLIVTSGFAWHTQDFQLDVSQESLVLEGDDALQYYESIQGRYGSDDVVIVTYTPDGDLFSQRSLEQIAALKGELLEMERVESVLSILDVPLLRSPPVTLEDVQGGLRTLSDKDVDVTLAAKELRESILYKELLVGSDKNTTALQISFERDALYTSLREARNLLRSKQLDGNLTREEMRELTSLTEEFRSHTRSLGSLLDEDIAHIRNLIGRYEEHAEIHLAGGPMIVSDMISYVRHDLRVFGLAALAILTLLLAAIFRQPRWVLLPLATALATGIVTIGFVSLAGWLVTVVSSNFLPLVLIFTLSLSIHLIVHYRELQVANPDAEQLFLVRQTLRAKALPCLYTVMTTVVAFGSLVVSGIRPVIDFGWIMVLGLSIGFVLNFVIFPSVLMLLSPPLQQSEPRLTAIITGFCANVIYNHGSAVLLTTFVVTGVCGWGVSTLSVENSFINYFKESTEIYQGMLLADQKLGGTTPLDVIVDAPAEWLAAMEPQDGDEEWDLDYGIGGEPGFSATSYWFNTLRFEQIQALHEYLDSIDASGKVISLATTLQVLEQLNEGEQFDDFDLAVLYKKIPPDLKATMISPYLSEDGHQLRLAVRIEDSDPTLVRNQMLADIREHLVGELGYNDEDVQLTGMMVLYNNMLQSLFRSQILTLGTVMAVIAVAFGLLFRSVPVALVAITPNIIAAVFVLGIMGLLGIPLDIMTITIAAITVGIAVDDTIHYLHRFRLELEVDGDYAAAVKRSHASIGSAMYYTSSCVTIGFSIFALSDFIPTIYFGILTALAMVAALAADLIILPLLLERFRPFRTGVSARADAG
ncbi:MAG: putative RND superfamily exporter protein [Hyphomicrobiaceae bacterium]|jgi:predicted RND superfamily exporter protein